MMPSRSATPAAAAPPPTTSYWCYSCTRFISVSTGQDANAGGYASCPHCNGGFIEEAEDSSAAEAPATTPVSQFEDGHRSVIRRRRSDRRTSFNPVIVLHGGAGGERVENDDGEGDRRPYEFYYDDGSGSGLRPLPDSVSEILMGSGFERLLEQLSQIEASGSNGIGRSGNPPASKSAVESLPRVEIGESHVRAEANCAVCTEVFEAGAEGREMPCKHVFHGDCIVPWLSIRNSCPVCRFELPSDPVRRRRSGEEEHAAAVGMTIWRLPGGGFAVGRFNAGVREGERVLPVVLTEVDGGGLGSGEGPRRISWVRDHGAAEISGNGGARAGRLRRAARGVVSFMRRMRPNRGSSSNVIDLDTNGESRVMNRSTSLIGRMFR